LGGDLDHGAQVGVGVEDHLSGGFVNKDCDGTVDEDTAGVEGEVLHLSPLSLLNLAIKS
jgi:hypothetical protein